MNENEKRRIKFRAEMFRAMAADWRQRAKNAAKAGDKFNQGFYHGSATVCLIAATGFDTLLGEKDNEQEQE